ncbi:ArfGap-domain-containing protein [Auriscalpium vulgare]|uniref:ArfGap-domain-containing protein n=1 Tax=Auriscalpium vulgare TaxID=40419 RepID=A0ACB8SBU0_9AGAM|nr:ArfGap-domain-containing protein [Auriscalpium vulgare]
MSDQAAAKRTLQELIKRDDLKNRNCVDCGGPNPQWASLSFAVFICLQCAGIHRGFGVHISFVRSVSMDTWQDEQVRRMKIGGNAPFVAFMQAYQPADVGGYKEGMPIHDKYHSWAATQYREKLDADLQGKSWSPSSPPENFTSPGSSIGSPGRPSSAQGLRKARASARTNTGTSLRGDSASPASLSYSNPTSPGFGNSSGPLDQKTANESYFATLGSANATRSADLPPSQGGRYQGFGNTPSPQPDNPAFGLTSRAAPSLSELQENPLGALSKGWSLFSSAVVGAGRAVSENIIQPGVEKVTDPDFQANVRGYVSEAGRRAGEAATTANQWGKSQLGVDVGNQVGGVVAGVRERVGGPSRSGYDSLSTGGGNYNEHSSLYNDEEEDDFFGEYSNGGQSNDHHSSPPSGLTNRSAAAPAPTATKKADDWDDWKEF